jgi:hypothetical protein
MHQMNSCFTFIQQSLATEEGFLYCFSPIGFFLVKKKGGGSSALRFFFYLVDNNSFLFQIANPQEENISVYEIFIYLSFFFTKKNPIGLKQYKNPSSVANDC